MQAYSVVDDDREIFYEKRKDALVVVQRRREVGLKCKSREIWPAAARKSSRPSVGKSISDSLWEILISSP